MAMENVKIAAKEAHPKVKKARVIGTIAAFEIDMQGIQGYLNPAGRIIKEKAFHKGVFLRPLGQVIYLLPPLCITDEQLERCYEAIHYGLQAL